MATITLPADYAVRGMDAAYDRGQGVLESSYSLKRYVQNWGGKRRRVMVTIPPCKSTIAAQWTQFFEDLNGCVNDFNLDITVLFPHDAGASSVPFKLADPSITWNANEAKIYGFIFEAIEEV